MASDHPGVAVGGWTLRWAGDQWTVGYWKRGAGRTRWRKATWHGRFDQALRKLLERNIGGEVADLREAVERAERVYAEIGRAFAK